MAQAIAQAGQAKDILGKTEIRSPISGIVSRLRVREGEMVVMNPRKHLDLFDQSRFPVAPGEEEALDGEETSPLPGAVSEMSQNSISNRRNEYYAKAVSIFGRSSPQA